MNFPYSVLKYIAGAAAVMAVAPAHATGGFSCSTTGEREIAIGMTLGRTPVLQPIDFVIIIATFSRGFSSVYLGIWLFNAIVSAIAIIRSLQ